MSVSASATIVGGKIGMYVWGLGPDPPSDPTDAMHWRRRWLAYSAVSALPDRRYGRGLWRPEPFLAVLIAMALGTIGFPLFLDGAQ